MKRKKIEDGEVFTSCLKVEILRPLDLSWDVVGARLHAARRTLPQALNACVRALYPTLLDVIHPEPSADACRWSSELCDTPKRRQVVAACAGEDGARPPARVERVSPASPLSPPLQSQLYQAAVSEAGLFAAALERDAAYQRKLGKDTSSSHAPFYAAVVDASTKVVITRFSGEHLADLRTNQASIPSWKRGAPLVARAVDVTVTTETIDGRPEAVLGFPLWVGSKCRFVMMLGRQQKMHQRRAQWELIASGQAKLGTVGIHYDERRRKWYALIAYSRTVATPTESVGTVAAVNFGINVALQAVASDGATFRVEGSDILTFRKRMAHRRAAISANLETHGTGSKGHGRRRRMRPITDLGDKESRYVRTKNQQTAAALLRWCVRNRVATLVLEDLTGIRDGAEERPGEDRLLHSWPFYDLGQAVKRAAEKYRLGIDGRDAWNVTVIDRACAYDSQTCPACGHVAEGNSTYVDGAVDVIEHHGRMYERRERVRWFKCLACRHEADGDVINCQNALARYARGDIQASTAKTAKGRRREAKKRETTNAGEAS